MKTRIFTLFIFLQCIINSHAQLSHRCDELFFSEYVEGSRNNKALEIYNPTNKPIDLSRYRISRWANGNSVATLGCIEKISGLILPGKCWVIVINRRDTTKVGLDTPVVRALRIKANAFLSPPSIAGSLNFNGDDAISLEKYDSSTHQYVIIDLIGKIGEKPNPCWTDQFPYNGKGKWYTLDRTLVRKSSVVSAVDTSNGVLQWKKNPLYFNPADEWMLLPKDMFDSLGRHTCQCNSQLGIELEDEKIEIGPNPNSDGFEIQLNKVHTIKCIKIVNELGQDFNYNGIKQNENVVRINWLTEFKGTFIVIVELENGHLIQRKGIRE